MVINLFVCILTIELDILKTNSVNSIQELLKRLKIYSSLGHFTQLGQLRIHDASLLDNVKVLRIILGYKCAILNLSYLRKFLSFLEKVFLASSDKTGGMLYFCCQCIGGSFLDLQQFSFLCIDSHAKFIESVLNLCFDSSILFKYIFSLDFQLNLVLFHFLELRRYLYLKILYLLNEVRVALFQRLYVMCFVRTINDALRTDRIAPAGKAIIAHCFIIMSVTKSLISGYRCRRYRVGISQMWLPILILCLVVTTIVIGIRIIFGLVLLLISGLNW